MIRVTIEDLEHGTVSEGQTEGETIKSCVGAFLRACADAGYTTDIGVYLWGEPWYSLTYNHESNWYQLVDGKGSWDPYDWQVTLLDGFEEDPYEIPFD